MKKRNLTLLTAFAAAAAFAPTAQATITGTPSLSDMPHTGTTDWLVTSDECCGNGTLEIAGGSLLDMNGHYLFLGWGTATTVTVTGDGSKLLHNNANADLGVTLGRNVGAGHVIIEEGGWFEATGSGRAVMISQTGPGTASVSGAGSKLTSVNGQLIVGMYNNHPGIMTVDDSGLVQTKTLIMGFDGAGEGYVHMGDGGVLAVEGNHMTNPFVSGGLFTKPGGSIGEIQYNPSGDGTTWENMNGAATELYTLTYAASGGPTVNGQDLSGYTVLTMLGGTTPAADPEITSITSITSLGGGVFELTLKGENSTAYQFFSSPTLDFTPPGTLVLLTVSGTPDLTDVTTDGSGNATVEMSPGGSVNFVRAVGP